MFKVPAASGSSVFTTADFYYRELANTYEKLPNLHQGTVWCELQLFNPFFQGATSKVEAFNAYKNSMTYIGALLNHLGTAGKVLQTFFST